MIAGIIITTVIQFYLVRREWNLLPWTYKSEPCPSGQQ